ncbi:hypothetical protein HYU16_04290 [Candidatus Woesearchaeota archaeon]|nr:hypothetical protein [Candidatus Woesearchaeota archaeon]
MPLEHLTDSAFGSVLSALTGRQPLVALSMLDGMVKSSLGKIDDGFPYRKTFVLRLSAYWNLKESNAWEARMAREFGLEDRANFFEHRALVYGELRAAEVALHNGENSMAAGSFYIAEALAAGAGIKIGQSFQQLDEFYFWARHL